MKVIKKLSPATKMVLLIMYTFILFAIAVLIITTTNIDETKGYGSYSRDENIQVVAKLTENRVSNYLTKETKEQAKWSISYQIAKNNPEVEVTDIDLYVKAKTEENKMVFFEKINVKKPNNGSSNFYTYSSISKTNTKSGDTYKKTNSQLSIVYTTIRYTVKENENETIKELKYFFVPSKPEQIDFNSFTKEQTIKITNNNQEEKVFGNTNNGYNIVYVKPTMNELTSTAETKQHDTIKISLKCDEKFFQEENKFVVNSSVTMFAKVKNDLSDTENYFDDYITVVDLHGTFVNGNNKNAWTTQEINALNQFYTSQCSIDTVYEVSDLYLLISYTLNDGKTVYDRLLINLDC